MICILLIFFSFPIALTSVSSAVLKRSRDSGQPGLIPYYNEIDSDFSPFNIMDFSYVAFITLRYVPSTPTPLRHLL